MTSPQNSSDRLKADLVLALLTAYWGFTFVLVKDALADADSFTFLALRFLIGAVVLTPFAGRALFDARCWRRGVVQSAFLFLGFVFQTQGLLYTTPARSAFITGLAVILVPVLSILVYRKLPSPFSVLGVVLAVFGLYAMTFGGTEVAQATLKGDLLTLACALAYSFHITLNERFSQDVSAAALVSVQLWMVALLSALCMPFVELRFVSSGMLWIALGLSGVLSSAVAIALQTWAQRRTTAVRAALIFSLEPVYAAAFSMSLGREAFGLKDYVGGALIVAGVVVAEGGPLALDFFRRKLGFGFSAR